MEEPGNGGDLEQDMFEEQQDQDEDLLQQLHEDEDEDEAHWSKGETFRYKTRGSEKGHWALFWSDRTEVWHPEKAASSLEYERHPSTSQLLRYCLMTVNQQLISSRMEQQETMKVWTTPE
jgi:enterochelin esterase-like enzyme